MNNIIDIYSKTFNGREQAVIILSITFLIYSLFIPGMRKSYKNLIEILFSSLFLKIIISILLYIAFITYLLKIIGFWNITMLKDTIIWGIFAGFMLFMKVINVKNKRLYFKELIKDSLKLLVVYEFLINLYTFNVWIELVLMPCTILVVLVQTYVKDKAEYIQVEKVVNRILIMIGLIVIYKTVHQVMINWNILLTLQTLKNYYLPIILTMLYLPFLYSWALITLYDIIVIRINMGAEKSSELKTYAKTSIIKFCGLDFERLDIMGHNAYKFMKIENKEDVVKIIEHAQTESAKEK